MFMPDSTDGHSLSEHKNLTANTRGLGYLIHFRVICHLLEVAHQEFKGVIIVIWEVVDLDKVGWGGRNVCSKEDKKVRKSLK